MDTGIEGGTSSFNILWTRGEERGMENDVMLGEMSGKRMRGSPRTILLDNAKNIK